MKTPIMSPGPGSTASLAPSGPRVDLERLRPSLDRVVRLQHDVRDVHPLFAASYPIAVVENSTFYVFEPILDAGGYALSAVEAVSIPVPPGVRAAFPLDSLDGRAACVITPDAFDSMQGYVLILHEFAHCHQWATCEPGLREGLELARKARAAGDVMWEISYPFPYARVEAIHRQWIAELERGHLDSHLRLDLRARLTADDWDYLTWQEWKEGSARYIENRIRSRLGLSANRRGHSGELDRTSFYAGGALYAAYLISRRPTLASDMALLFSAMRDSCSAEHEEPEAAP
jgi:hypothetical protein